MVPVGMGLPGVDAEGYELEVRRGGVTLQASGYPGIFYGLETLSQLIMREDGGNSNSWMIPSVDIDDIPRFQYRGMHLDVGRHYFPVAFIKRYLDFLAVYKMNVFHWHLTEDQGWRIEILGCPRLTEVGSCRAETIVEKNFDPYIGDGIRYCGYYTQEEVREVVWSPVRARDWSSFLGRLPSHLRRLDEMGANYRVPDVFGLEGDQLTLDDWVPVEISAPVGEGEIRFTLDGSDPGASSLLYVGPYVLLVDEEGFEMKARVILPDGREGAVRGARFQKTELAHPTPLSGAGRAQGLEVRVVGGSFGTIMNGFIRVPRKGIYTFFLTSDDGSSLQIDGQMVVDNDGYHSMLERQGQVALHRGWHPLEVRYFQGGGGAAVRLEIEGPDLARRQVPAHWFSHATQGGI